MVLPAELEPPARLEQHNKRTYQFPDIHYETYQRLPDSIRLQFSFEQINNLVSQTETYLNTRTKGELGNG